MKKRGGYPRGQGPGLVKRFRPILEDLTDEDKDLLRGHVMALLTPHQRRIYSEIASTAQAGRSSTRLRKRGQSWQNGASRGKRAK